MTQPEDTTPTPSVDPPGDPTPTPPTEEPLGEGGKAALVKEREARKAAEAELAKYRKAEQEKADAERSEAERRTAAEARVAELELAALRREVADEHGLTAAQARRLVGSTREELQADAADLLSVLAPARTGPKPDPSQGAKGSAAQPSLDDQIRDAQARGDYRAVIALQTQKLAKAGT